MLTLTQRAVMALESLENYQRDAVQAMMREIELRDPPSARWIVEGAAGRFMVYGKHFRNGPPLVVAYYRVEGGVEVQDILVGRIKRTR